MAEHVAQRDGGQALDVFGGQSGCLTELEEPQGQDEDGAHDELGHADAPRQGDGVKGFLGAGGGGEKDVREKKLERKNERSTYCKNIFAREARGGMHVPTNAKKA